MRRHTLLAVIVVCLSALAAAGVAGCENSDTPGGGSGNPGRRNDERRQPEQQPRGRHDERRKPEQQPRRHDGQRQIRAAAPVAQ